MTLTTKDAYVIALAVLSRNSVGVGVGGRQNGGGIWDTTEEEPIWL